MDNETHNLVQEFSEIIFGTEKDKCHAGGTLSDVFNSYLQNNNFSQRYFNDETRFVFDKKVSESYPIPAILYETSRDRGKEILSYLQLATRPLFGKGELAFHRVRDEKDFRFHLLPMVDQQYFSHHTIGSSEELNVIVRDNAYYKEGRIFRDRLYDHIWHANKDVSSFKEDEQYAVGMLEDEMEYWEFRSVDDYLRKIGIFWTCLSYGAISGGNPVKYGVAAPNSDIINREYFEFDCMKIDFDKNILYQVNLELSNDKTTHWSAAFSEISLLNRSSYFNTPLYVAGLTDPEEATTDDLPLNVLSRLESLEKNNSATAPQKKFGAKSAITEYCDTHNLNLESIVNVSSLSHEIAEAYGLKKETIRRAITAQRELSNAKFKH